MITEGMNESTMNWIAEYREHGTLELPCPVPDEYVVGLICDFGSLTYALTKQEHNYDMMKHNYEMGLIELKYSDEFQEFKTIKEKEEHARLTLADEKEALLEAEYQLHLLKANIEACEKTLKLVMRVHGRENHE